MYEHYTLSNGVDLYTNSTRKFRTNLVQVFVARPLDEFYTRYALLANVLKRGSKSFPTTIELAKRWDSLYGAMFTANIYKLGEHHVYELSLELANERYLASQERVLKEGLLTLAGMLDTPYLPDGQLDSSHVAQEQEALARAIDSLFNDKSAYSSVRCIEEMCSNEPYARLELGNKGEISSITPKVLTEFYQESLPKAKVRVIISGDIDSQEARSVCEEAFAGIKLQTLPSRRAQIDVPVSAVRVKHEEQDISQGKLVLGYRTYTDCAAPDYPALVMYNGILGAFPHSKLFMNVREKASLAYYCSSSLLPVKGLMLIRSGIGLDKYTQALEIIAAQLQAMAQGDFSEDEFTNTRLALINELQADEDRPSKLGRSHIERLVAEADYSNHDFKERIAQVNREDVVRMAERVQLDTIYFLHGKE